MTKTINLTRLIRRIVSKRKEMGLKTTVFHPNLHPHAEITGEAREVDVLVINTIAELVQPHAVVSRKLLHAQLTKELNK